MLQHNAVYCCYCMKDAVEAGRLFTGRCRHAFCAQCVTVLEDCEVVTCPYDLSAMLREQIQPSRQLQLKIAQMKKLKAKNEACDSDEIRVCGKEMQACVNLQGVPCKLAVMTHCPVPSRCPYSHSPSLLRSTRETINKMAQDSKTTVESEPAPTPATEYAPNSTCGPVRCITLFIETMVLGCVLVSLQVVFLGLVVCWMAMEVGLKVLKGREGGVVTCAKLPMLCASWVTLRLVLLFHSLLRRLSQSIHVPIPLLQYLLTPTLSIQLP